MNYPRVLVISPVKFNQETGSGVTMGNLFRGWPIDCIAQIHSDNYTLADFSVCKKYFHLPYYQVRFPNFFRSVFSITHQAFRYLNRKQISFAGQFLHTKDLLTWCKEFQPDIIYARPHHRPSFYIWLPLKIQQELSIPMVTRVLDDWPARYAHDQAFIRRLNWNLILKHQVRTLFTRSKINIGISKEMCDAFSERYKSKFIPFHNCIEIDDWTNIKKKYHASDPFTILYLGTVTKDKELESLIDIKNAILTLREQGYNIQLIIYGPKLYQETIETFLVTPPHIKYGGYFPIEMKQKILSSADLLILPINFDKASQIYVGYSFQTKVPEYMASGTPTLVYGPASNPNVMYASKYNWGAVVKHKDQRELLEMLKSLISNQELREQFGNKARELVLINHDAKIIRHNFLETLCKIA